MEKQISQSLEENVSYLKTRLNVEKNFDIIYKPMIIDSVGAGLFLIDGFVDDGIMQRIMQFLYGLKRDKLKDATTLAAENMPYVEVETGDGLEAIITNLLSGVVILLIDGFDKAIMIDCRTYPMRSVDEPAKDKVMRGSRDGFVETLVFNAALLRRRIRCSRFCVEVQRVGERSKSDIALCYLEDKADSKLLDRLRTQIKSLKVEALTMSSESLAECLLQGRYINPFPKFKYSERPDTAAAAIYDGNIVILVDNSPAAIIIPTSIFDMLEEADDFYFPPFTGTYLRISRFIITIACVFITPVWLLLLQNPNVVPQWLSFILIKDEITVPIFWQLIILELAIDGLKLASVNTPSSLSTPLSVVAGIIVGEYAISSGWFNGESMLYMAFVTIATYSQASFEMGYGLKFVRILLLVLTKLWNFWGFIIGIIINILMISTNNTLSGKSYLYPLIPFNGKRLARKLFRLRIPYEYRR